MLIYNTSDIYPVAAFNEKLKEDTFNNVAAEINALLGPKAWDGGSVKIVGKSVSFKDGKYAILDETGQEIVSTEDRLEVIKAVLILEKMDSEKKIVKEVKASEYESAKPERSVKKNGKGGLDWEVEIPIVKIDAPQHLVGGLVYAPDEVDAQGDSASAEEIQKAAHHFMMDSREIGIMHKEAANTKVKIVESYITPAKMQVGDQFFRKGSWIIVVKILDDVLWKRVESGELGGFSMGGRAQESSN